MRIKHDDKLPENTDVHFQIAVLYTTSFGRRRIRVHTLSLRCTKDLADVYRGADMDALLAVMAKFGACARVRVWVGAWLAAACVLASLFFLVTSKRPSPLAQRVRRARCVLDAAAGRAREADSNDRRHPLVLPQALHRK